MKFDKDWKSKNFYPLLLLPLLFLLPARSAWAQMDLAGEWASRNSNNGLDVGDYGGIPLSDAGRLRAESWAPEAVDLPENICRPHPFDVGFNVAPSDLYIWKEIDQATQQLVAYHIHSYWSDDVTVWMDGREHPPDYAAHKWQGFSTGKWEGNTLVITTTHLKEGYLTRSGVISSAKRTVTMRLNRYGDYMTGVFIIDDPAYLTEPFIRESSWYYQPFQVFIPNSCEAVDEGAILPAGSVPSFLPGKNDILSDFAVEYGIPPDSALGGAETVYPEYIDKMKTMKKVPRTNTTHFKRTG